ncbi:TPA: hyaluronoglucosaminidase [Streptococcus pyogenes]|uniref:Hyaluronidase-phage-associated n=3 Tax=Streptococcus pyogenes TaxID=1314 RepID=A0A0H2UU56_STRP3|nr:hyaluronoglucosaminidase [Streptococcus pyogenes]NP_795417.1 hyaluronidase [Streptococcus phage 315.1]NP_795700.1 putative hyaluronidase [Streptococcus phage 315.6]QBX19747.1 hyaluronate lyase [Streptococcus phage Javan497]QBX20078.1 hyaluronate lyase [Streptococcus phage Javan507]QBX20777.1 hyaluronate lyase [Streptococcus phage Javan531]QBX29752.1 hyaluronate lyase [Streptococcus phage Javan512]HEP6168636.1 hyaluronoglucosaminidase [Streptococcus pyogenes ABC020047934]HEP6170306.1 hyal
MTETIPLRVQFKRMTAEEWARSTVILLEGEIGLETDTGYAKFGDGKNRFSKLKYLNKPDLDAFAQKKETDNKIAKLESIKADKDTVYLKAESKIELDKKLSLAGGIVTGQLRLKPNSGIEKSSSTGGAINIDMSKSKGAAMVMYTNKDTTDGPLMILRSNKDTFDQSVQFVDYRGKTNAVNIVMRQPPTPNFSSALNITSANEGGSAMQIRGVEKALGTLKITHENPSVDKEYDKNAAALSIDIVKKKKGGGDGTAAQGIFINSSSGTTGKLLRIRNKNEDKFYVNPDGGFHSYADSIVDGNLTVKNPTSGKHAATKDYVDKKFDELKKLIQKTD